MLKYPAIITLLIILTFPMLVFPNDNYPKNPNIDIRHYRFDLKISDESDKIDGKATIDIHFLAKGIEEVRLDFVKKSAELEEKGMVVNGVNIEGKTVHFSHENDVLMVYLPKPTNKGQYLKIQISYSGIPYTGLKIGPNKYGDRTFFSDNWPNKARHWLPTVDHPHDKATSEMVVTAPEHYQVVSNGLLIEETNLENQMKLTHWKQSVPIACWLYVLGVADFAVQYVDNFRGKSIQTWVYRQDRDAGFYDFAVPTRHCMEFFSDYVGPFAYEKLANIQSNSVGGGMEAASAILYGDKSVTGERSVRWRNVIIHEVAHQWFGNAVTEYDWDDVWLSEGITTYFTLLFREHAYGREDFVDGLKDSRDQVFNFYKDNKDYRIVHDNLTDMEEVVSRQTYQKGAWVMHMLRNLVGDDNFWKGIRLYYKRYMNGSATTNDFKHEMEMASNMSLTAFFDQWLYQGGNIVLKGSWQYDSSKKEIKINLTQAQNDGYLFSFPMEFGIYEPGEVTPRIVTIDFLSSSETFTFTCDTEPEEVKIDPRTILLAKWEWEKGQ